MHTPAPTTAQNVRRYTVKDTWKEYEVTLEVNHDILTVARAEEINSFWSDDDHRLDQLDGDVVKTVIQLFGQNAICLYLNENGANFGDADNWLINKCSQELRGEEGWGGESEIENNPYGWCGIRIVGADVDMPSFEDLELTEASA